MKNILMILSESGIEVTEEQKEAISTAVSENYKPIADYNNIKSKRDEYKTSLDEVQETLEGFKDVDVEGLRGQIQTLTGDLQSEKDARAEDARKVELERSVETFLSEKKFVNEITAKSIKEQLTGELDKDSAKGKSIEDIFSGLITDGEGNQMENILVSDAEQNRAKFTAQKKTTLPPTGAKISPSELMKLKNEDPDLDISQYM